MAGGVGTRFWPLSKTQRPKQFLDILGTGKTLLQDTFHRFTKSCPIENILIVTSEMYKEEIQKQIPEMEEEQILLEPTRRNTAPCIAYACYKIKKRNENANIIVAPSDHIILNDNEFQNIINEGLEFVEKNNSLLTLGIKPSRPDTGYGYIQFETEEVKEFSGISKVRTFTEKPNIEIANEFLKSGDFYWNSGIFLWSLKSILESFENNLPEINTLFKEGLEFYDTSEETIFIQKTYSVCRSISIDYGIMEKAENVYMLRSDFGWSDLGTWGSLFENSDKKEDNNVVMGDNILTYDSKNCIVNMPKDKLVVIQGLDNYIVVESDDTLLICKKDDEQQIRKFVDDVRTKVGEKYV